MSRQDNSKNVEYKKGYERFKMIIDARNEPYLLRTDNVSLLDALCSYEEKPSLIELKKNKNLESRFLIFSNTISSRTRFIIKHLTTEFEKIQSRIKSMDFLIQDPLCASDSETKTC